MFQLFACDDKCHQNEPINSYFYFRLVQLYASVSINKNNNNYFHYVNYVRNLMNMQ